jgi:hypothetical protein
LSSRRLLAVAACATAVLALPAAAGANVPGGTVTKSAGTVGATLSWKSGPAGVSKPRLKIRRAGAVAADLDVAKVCGRYCTLVEDSAGNAADVYTIMHVADLDGDGEPEVMFDTFSGGAHCCITQEIYGYKAATGTYAHTASEQWGNSSYDVQDLDGNGSAELYGGDDTFAGAFSSYAASAFPPEILAYGIDPATGRARLKDVTRRFPAQIEKQAAQLLKVIRKAKASRDHEIQGALAAYVADQYLLGKGAVGKAELVRARKRKLTVVGFQTDLLRTLKAAGYRGTRTRT